MRILCVAEKPSIARAIAEALGGGSVRKTTGASKFNPNHELTYNFTNQWGSSDVTVTSVLGHLTEVQFPPPFNQWTHDPGALYSAPVKVTLTKDSEKVAKNISQLARNSQILYIWTDGDREGEHIGSEIADVAKKSNSRIIVKRADFSHIEPSHIRQAASRPRDLRQNVVEAVNVRRELDLRTGFSMTRFQDIFRNLFQLREPVSYGSCQFPTLGFVVERYFKVKNFKPEQFWYIDLNVKKGLEKLSLNWDRGRLYDHASAFVLYEQMLAANTDAIVDSVTVKPTKQYKPLPLTTVMLQRLCSKFLKMNSKKIMDISEKLYQRGYVSYPRTETDVFPPDFDLKQVINRQVNLPEMGDYAKKLLDEGKFAKPRNGKHNDKAHPPIHPVMAAQKQNLTSDEWSVYEFITRHFLACCSEDAIGEETQVNVTFGGEKFHAKGVVVKALNYLEIYKYAKWNSASIPSFHQGEVLSVTSCYLKDGKTSPPQFLTESELIALMAANGIGTDATIADHISKIKEREFVEVSKNRLVPTNLGTALYKAYDAINLEKSITKPQLRQETELNVTKIATGELQKHQVMTRMVADHEKIYKSAKNSTAILIREAKKFLN